MLLCDKDSLFVVVSFFAVPKNCSREKKVKSKNLQIMRKTMMLPWRGPALPPADTAFATNFTRASNQVHVNERGTLTERFVTVVTREYK